MKEKCNTIESQSEEAIETTEKKESEFQVQL